MVHFLLPTATKTDESASTNSTSSNGVRNRQSQQRRSTSRSPTSNNKKHSPRHSGRHARDSGGPAAVASPHLKPSKALPSAMAKVTQFKLPQLPPRQRYCVIRVLDIDTSKVKLSSSSARCLVVVTLDDVYIARNNPFDLLGRKNSASVNFLDLPCAIRPPSPVAPSSPPSASKKPGGKHSPSSKRPQMHTLHFEVYEAQHADRDVFVGSYSVQVDTDELQRRPPTGGFLRRQHHERRLKLPLRSHGGGKAGTLECAVTVVEGVEYADGEALLHFPSIATNYAARFAQWLLNEDPRRELIAILVAPLVFFAVVVGIVLALSQSVTHAVYLPLVLTSVVLWLWFPLWLGSLVTRFANVSYLGGRARTSLGPLITRAWLTRNWRIHIVICAHDLAIYNPVGFPFREMLSCGKISLQLSLPWRGIFAMIRGTRRRVPLHFDPNFMCTTIFHVDHLELEDLMLDFQLWEGRFNLNEFMRRRAQDHVDRALAKSKAVRARVGLTESEALWKEQRKLGEDEARVTRCLPNYLEVAVLGCRNLDVVEAIPQPETKDDGIHFALDEHSLDFDGLDLPHRLMSNISGVTNVHDNDALERASLSSVSSLMSESDKNGGSSDKHRPYVVVTVRKLQAKTRSRAHTRSPKWENEHFGFLIEDPSAVLHVKVINKVNGAVYGQWIMSLHNMVGSPQRCRHVGPVVLHDAGAESGTPRGARGTDVWLQGRFPLMNESWTRRHGEINMRFRWTYANPATLAKAAKARQLLRPAPHYRPSAFTQMKMFIQEMTLLVCNLGDLDTEDAQNDALPYLLDIQRVTVRRARAYVKDLLRGHKGEVEGLKKRGLGFDRADAIKIPVAEWTREFHAHGGDPGITIAQALFQLINLLARHGVYRGGGIKQGATTVAYRLSQLLGITQAGAVLHGTTHTAHAMAKRVAFNNPLHLPSHMPHNPFRHHDQSHSRSRSHSNE